MCLCVGTGAGQGVCREVWVLDREVAAFLLPGSRSGAFGVKSKISELDAVAKTGQ